MTQLESLCGETSSVLENDLDPSLTNLIRRGPVRDRKAAEKAASACGDEALFGLRGKEVLALDDGTREQTYRRAVEGWQKRGFPYTTLTKAESVVALRAIRRALLRSATLTTVLKDVSTAGLTVVNAFHPQMWHTRVRTHTKSPHECFWEPDTLRRVLERNARFFKERRCWAPWSVRNGLRVYSAGRVSNFRPVLAAGILESFQFDGTVLDFCAGYSGRLLGAAAIGRSYLGIDASEYQCIGARRLIEHLRSSVSADLAIRHGAAEDLLPGIAGVSTDLIFSSPPYFDYERYLGNESLQSHSRYQDYSSWHHSFLRPTICEAGRILAAKGRLLLIVANTRGVPLIEDTADTMRRAGFVVTTREVRFVRGPSYRRKRGKWRSEALLIGRKRPALERTSRMRKSLERKVG